MRAPGFPMTAFSLDTEIQALARKLAMDLVAAIKKAALEAVAEVMRDEVAHEEPEAHLLVEGTREEPGTPVTDRVLAFLGSGPGRRSQEIQEAVGLDRLSVRNVLDVLLAEGRIVKLGRGGGTTYRLKSVTAARHDELHDLAFDHEMDAAPRTAPVEPEHEPAVPPLPLKSRPKPPSPVPDRVLFFIRAKRGLRSEEIRAALGLDKDEMRKAVAVLLAEGKITKEGELRGTRYRPG
jgi:hypothetical protein